LDNDAEFSCRNIEVELKNFIMENYDINKKDVKYLKIDLKKLSAMLVKFENNSNLVHVLNKICIKKNGQLMILLPKYQQY
jgi:hypothetical protein